jgi:hypothetical protein
LALKSSDSKSLLKNNSKKLLIAAQQSYDVALESARENNHKKVKKHKKDLIEI